MTTLVWFRQDLRVADNPALAAAREDGGGVVPVYIFAPEEEEIWRPGAAACWWLHHSLDSLAADLSALGSRLVLRRSGNSLGELLALARDCGADRIVWNRRYEPLIRVRDTRVKEALREAGFAAHSFNGALLHEPAAVKSGSGGAFQVFTPFWRRCLALPDPPAPVPAPRALPVPAHWPVSQTLADFQLLPVRDWCAGIRAAWLPGSAAAQVKLDGFLRHSFADYAQSRNRPDLSGTSRLSPHLHFGEIGPRQVWHAARAAGSALSADWRGSQFLAELGWREFGHHLLYHFPRLPGEALRANFRSFPWKSDLPALRRWQRGETGYPIVDAGMRELWQTGWMHNRVRMIAASFLVKDLLLSWEDGARWFWDTLVDADLAANTLGWQWVAGCGADAAPFFRIFNPGLQGAKFDPAGRYVRRWIPEIAKLPDQWLHQPWLAPPEVLRAGAVRLGRDYPDRLVEHGAARAAALAALSSITSSSVPT